MTWSWSTTVDALQCANVLPLGTSCDAEPHDLLTFIATAWQASDSPPPSWLDALAGRSGTSLTLGFPQRRQPTSFEWIGPRLIWWPRERPDTTWIGLASSRLSQPDRRDHWFRNLRAVCAKLDRDTETLITAQGSAPAEFAERAAELFGVRLTVLVMPDEQLAIGDWLTQVGTHSAGHGDVSYAYVSPPLSHIVDGTVAGPLQDRAVIAAADRLLVFQLRRGGRLEPLIRLRLADPNWPTASVTLALGPDLVRRDLADELLELGAVGWVVLDDDTQPAQCDGYSRDAERSVAITSVPPTDGWSYLTHCTRRRDGPWPGDSDQQYFDDLILASPDKDHSPLSALRRIVEQQRLAASADLVRGNEPVISFTAVPLAELDGLRTFRSHLSRWDFEPFGICIDREWLKAHGCRPVIYGDDESWEAMSTADRPFFQRQSSRGGKQPAIDWTVEREWRHLGDLDLHQVPSDAAILFVPTLDAAEALATVSRWPIAVKE